MATTISGTITTNVNLNSSIPSGGTVLTAYTVPINITTTTSYATGSAANQINYVASTGGTATAAPVNIDMTSLKAEDGTAISTSNTLREVIIFNDATNSGYVLNLVLDAANAWTAFMSGTLTGVKLAIQAGMSLRLSRPTDSTGWAIGSGTKVLSLDPGANTVPYRVVLGVI